MRIASSADAGLIRDFNARLAAGGIKYSLPPNFALEGEREFWRTGSPVFRELLIAEDSSGIHAGVLLQHGTFIIRGEARPFSWLQLPLSEGLVDRSHSAAFLKLMRAALRESPFAASLGIGSMEEPYARFLQGWKWKHQTVPFVFYPVKPGRVFAEIQAFRSKGQLRAAAQFASRSGAGAVLGACLAVHRTLAQRASGYKAMVVPVFDDWCDALFEKCLPEYSATVKRDAIALNTLYPPSEPQYIRLRVQKTSTGEDLGWLLLLNTQMRGNKYFGNLKVGTIVTGFGRPDDTPILIHAGLTYLAQRGAELVVANWSHKAWLGASRRLGFVPGPSNFLFFVSPGGAPLLDSSCPLNEIHLTRGDCDAPSSLMTPRSMPA